jgi:glycosyltransferase involved in cell wall biosynthesis
MSASNTSSISQLINNKASREPRSQLFRKDPTSFMQHMRAKSTPRRIAVVGNHLPRQCGIATFTNDLCDAIAVEYGAEALSVVAINDRHSSYAYPERVRFEIAEGDISSYRATANALKAGNVDLVCLQHEFGIFGGKSGSYVLQLLRELTMPVVTTLHTVLREPDLEQRIVMREIAALSNRLIVMSAYSSRVLQNVFGVPAGKIDLIPHGIPDLPFVEPEVYKDSLSIAGKAVLLTFGLLSTNKGFESVIRALPHILSRHKNVIYVIAGATHPHVKAREGDRYRHQLQALAKELGVDNQVMFLNRFVSPQEMASLVGSADIYITPYRFEAQAVSGTLAYALGAGKAIISTPYWHAAELLDEGRGVLVPFESPAAIASRAIELLDNDAARQAMRRRAYNHGRQMVWSRVAQSYMSSFVRASVNHTQGVHSRLPVQSVARIAGSRLASA